MIPKECKRLAEVDFPIAEVSKHSVREKSIRHGHPSTLHLWWARRPLAACRAVLLGLMLPDPCDQHCPEDFKKTARELLARVQGQVAPNDLGLRKALLKFSADFANWDLSSDRVYFELSRGLVKAAHPEETPLVVDPFAGGGSIPVEALRLGCETFASDLNPVACLILKVLLEYIPRNGSELAEELKRVGSEIKGAVEKQLADLYPAEKNGSRVIAYLWARTVRCEQPDCGAEIPLIRSLWLCKRGNQKLALRYQIVRAVGKAPELEFVIFAPKDQTEVSVGTVRQARATCPGCNVTMAPQRVRHQLSQQEGGATVIFDKNGNRTGGARLLAVVMLSPGGNQRRYRLPTAEDYHPVWKSAERLQELSTAKTPDGLSLIPDEKFHTIRPSPNARGLSAVTRYGITRFAGLYLPRQLCSLLAFCESIVSQNKPDSTEIDHEALRCLLALSLSRVADYCSAQSRWDSTQERNVNAFGRQALPMLWDFAELVPFRESVGSWDSMLHGVVRVIEKFCRLGSKATTQCADAGDHPLPSDAADVWFTDPPYYDNVPYADLSDFFYVWLKRVVANGSSLKNRFEIDNPLTPKLRECVWNRAYIVNGNEKDPAFFEDCAARAFKEGRRLIRDGGIGCVVFAHKTTEGWEALLSGLHRGGWTIVSSWPIATEQAQRLVARDTAALATSVHLICRPRINEKAGDWGEVRRELPKRIAEWMERLQSEHIRGADLVFACIGPALEIYSNYSKVVDAEDREIPLGGDPEATEPHKRGYLAYVWEAVGRAALEQVLGTADPPAATSAAQAGASGALEEDARLTALFLWTLQSTNGQEAEGVRREARGEEVEEDGDTDDEEESPSKKKKKGLTLVFDVVRRFAQPLGIHLDNWEDRIIETDKGIVRLVPVAERGEQLFGQDGADLVAERLEREPASTFQLTLFPEKTDAGPKVKGKKTRGKKARLPGGGQGTDKDLKTNQEATTLDRVHAAMLLQASGRTNALRALLQAEQDRSPDFLRLANALSALYPKQSEEKRLLDAMLLAMPK